MKANSEPLIQPFKEMKGHRKHLKDLIKFLLREGVYDGAMKCIGNEQFSILFRNNSLNELFSYNRINSNKISIPFPLRETTRAWRNEVAKIKRVEIAKDYDELGRIALNKWLGKYVKVFYDENGLINKLYIVYESMGSKWFSFVLDSRVEKIMNKWAFNNKVICEEGLEHYVFMYIEGFNDP